METIKLDLVPGKKMPSLHASQYDDGRAYHIDLTEKNEPYKLDGTEVLTVNERKGDNCICSLDIENTFADKTYVEFASTLQMCAVAGANICELVIKRGSVTLGTLNFILEIEPSPTEGGIESESEISNLERQITEITEEVIGDDYYTAEQTDEAIATATEGKADTTYVNTELAKKADKTDTYTKSQVDNAFNNKLDKANPTGTGSLSLNRKAGSTIGSNSVAMGTNTRATGTNTTALGNDTLAYGENSVAMGSGSSVSGTNSVAIGNHTKANSNTQFVFGKYNKDDNNNAYAEIVGNGTTAFTKSNARTLDWQGNETIAGDLTYNGNKSLTSEISRLDDKIDNLPAPMIFKGTLGTGGTIQTLPAASASNEGYTYKVITDGTYAGQTAKVGDVFTSNGSAWVYIPSGDEDNDTWRNIKVNGVEKLGNGISSGSLDVVDTDNIEAEFDNDGNKLKIKTKNIYTQAQVDAIVSDAIYNVLPDDTASGSVANFTTSLELPIKSLEVDVNAVQNAGTPTPASPLPISGWSEITLVNCGNKYKPNIKPFSEWERARSDYYISRFSVPNTIITVNLIDKDTTVDLSGISFGYVDSNWDTTTPLTTTKYRWFIQGGTVQSRKQNISAGDASIILTGLIFYPATEATYNKLMARYDYEFVFSETPNVEPYNTEVINLGGTYYGGHFTQDKDGHRNLTINMEKDTMSSSYLSGLSSSYIGYVASVPAMNNHPCIWVRNWKIPPACRERVSGGINAICNAFNISMNNSSIISTQYRIYFDVDGMNITSVADFISTVETMEQTGNNLEICYEVENPVVVNLPDGEPINTIAGTNNFFADTGDTEVVFKSSVNDYVSAHSGGNLLGMGGVYLGGAKSGGGKEETDEGEDTEKTKLDETKDEIKTIGDMKKLGGE